MKNLLIYIEDQLIKLSPGTTLAYSYQNTLISDLKTRRAEYSNEVIGPYCPENDLIFGHARLEKSNSEPVYRNLTAKIIRNGVQVPLTVCQVKGTEDGYRLNFFSGIKQFIDLLGDKTIDQLNNINNNLITWDAATIDSKRNSTDDIVAPVINYGQISRQDLFGADFTTGGGTASFEQLKLVPEGGSAAYQDSEFANDGTYIHAELDSFALDNGSFSYEQPGGTVMLRQKYRFYPGQYYEISLRHNYVGDSVYGRVYLMTEDPNVFQLVIDAAHSSATTDTVVITPTQEFFYIGIFGFLPPPTPTPTGTSDSGDLRVYFLDISLQIHQTTFAYFPSCYYKNIFQAIYEKAGYQVEQTSIFSDELYTKKILPFGKEDFEYTGFFNDSREFKASLSEPVTISVDGNIVFDVIETKDLFGFYNPTTGDYDTDGTGAYQPVETWDSRDFYAKFYAVLQVVLVSGTVQFQIRSQGFGAMVSQTISTPGRYNIVLTANQFADDAEGFLLTGGDVVSVYVDVTGGSVRVLNGYFYNTVNGANHEATDPRFYICELLPEIKQTDFVKDMFVSHGIVPFEKNKLLVLKSINEIISDRANALDWTHKRDKNYKDNIEYAESFAQNNYFAYPSNDDLFDPYYSRGNIKVPNETLKSEETLYESIFNGSVDFSLDSQSSSMYMGHVPINDTAKAEFPTPDGEDLDNDPGPRLMIVREKRAAEPNVDYNGNSRSDYLIANFLLPDKTQLGFEANIEKYYSGAKKGIERNKPFPRWYRLSEADIAQVHPHKLIYDDGSYFWLEKIDSHTGDGSTKCLLFKVS